MIPAVHCLADRVQSPVTGIGEHAVAVPGWAPYRGQSAGAAVDRALPESLQVDAGCGRGRRSGAPARQSPVPCS